MKKLNLTKEQFNKSRYFKTKYGSLKYVSESGKYFKTTKGNVLMFNEETERELKARVNKECREVIDRLATKAAMSVLKM